MGLNFSPIFRFFAWMIERLKKINWKDALGRWYILADAIMLITIVYMVTVPEMKVRAELLLIIVPFYLISKAMYPWEMARKWREGRDQERKRIANAQNNAPKKV